MKNWKRLFDLIIEARTLRCVTLGFLPVYHRAVAAERLVIIDYLKTVASIRSAGAKKSDVLHLGRFR